MAAFSTSFSCVSFPSPFVHHCSPSSSPLLPAPLSPVSPLFPSVSFSSSSSPVTLLHTPPPLKSPSSSAPLVCKAAEYVFPDPIPQFAEAESNKFEAHLRERLTKKKKDLFGDSIEEVVRVCTEILSNFLHTEYGGPGTLLVIPFIDMADTLNEKGLPGGPQAARAAVVWAQKNIDKDWNEWTKESK